MDVSTYFQGLCPSSFPKQSGRFLNRLLDSSQHKRWNAVKGNVGDTQLSVISILPLWCCALPHWHDRLLASRRLNSKYKRIAEHDRILEFISLLHHLPWQGVWRKKRPCYPMRHCECLGERTVIFPMHKGKLMLLIFILSLKSHQWCSEDLDLGVILA